MPKNVLVLAPFWAALSAFLGLVVRLGNNWAGAGKAAAGSFAFLMAYTLLIGLVKDRVPSRVTVGLTWAVFIAVGYALASGVAGKPYQMLGVVSLGVAGTDMWRKYRETPHYLERQDRPYMRLIAWIAAFEDPDRPRIDRPAKAAAGAVEPTAERPRPY
jgi:hypothetical protein